MAFPGSGWPWMSAPDSIDPGHYDQFTAITIYLWQDEAGLLCACAERFMTPHGDMPCRTLRNYLRKGYFGDAAIWSAHTLRASTGRRRFSAGSGAADRPRG